MPESYENFYPGLFRPPEYMPETAYSDLFVGYRLPAGKLGAGASAMTVNQIMEVFSRLNTGLKFVEAGTISPETFEKIPKQHFKEINRLAKLAGAEITWHAPIIDPAGLEEGGKLTEEARKRNEDLLWGVIERVAEATGGKQPITIHATAGIPATLPEAGVVGVANVVEESVGAIKLEPKIKPEEIAEGKKPEIPSPEKFLEEKNREMWDKFLEGIELRKVDIEPIVTRIPSGIEKQIEKQKKSLKDSYAYRYFGKHLNELKGEELKELETYLQKDKEARGLFNQLEQVEARAKESEFLFEDLMNRVEEAFKFAWKSAEVNKDDKNLKKLREIAKEISVLKQQPRDVAMTKLTSVLEKMKREVTPKIIVSAETFAKEKASETLSNLAVRAFEKFKDKAPIISVENIFPGMAFSTGKSLRGLIEDARKKFVEKMKDKVGEAKAKKLAEQLIGATWDIGHANIWKKYGKSPEEIKAEIEEIKPFIKHIHITDNFGFTDSHLPPGMGSIEPEVFKEIKDITEKQGVKALLEVPTLAIPPPHGFGVSPYTYSLAALGSPLYSYEMAPFWNQALAAELPAYFTGYGPILPEKHFELYGASFAGLPTELGGRLPGRKGFSEAPME